MKTASLALVALIPVLSLAQSATPPVPDAGQMLRQNIQPLPSLPPKRDAASAVQPAPVSQTPQTAASSRFFVSGFDFSGNQSYSSRELEALLTQYAGRELGLRELNEAAAIVTAHYRRGGAFLAQAYIPPQKTIPGSRVTIGVVEGVLEGLVLSMPERDTRVPRALLDVELASVSTGIPATEPSLTGLAMRLADLPAITARILMEPGTTPGSSRARVQVSEGKPWRVWLEGDNFGSYSTGFYRLGGRLSLYSPLHLGDQLDLAVKSTTTGDAQMANLSHSLPLGSAGFRLLTDYNFVNYKLGKNFSALDASGKAHEAFLRVEKRFIRTPSVSLSVYGGVGGKMLDDELGTFGSSNERRLFNVQAGASFVAYDKILGGGSSAVSLSLSSGEVDLRDSQARSNDAPPSGYGVHGGYSKLSLSVSRHQHLHRQLTLFLSASGQWTPGNLDSSEQFLLGGPYAVRAFPMQEAMCDLGLTTTMELRHPIGSFLSIPGNLLAGGFVDHADGWLRKDESAVASLLGADNTRSLTGAGFSLTWFREDSFSVRASIAWRVQGKLKGDAQSDNPSIYIHVIRQL